MFSEKQLGTAIIASILIPTISSILGGLVLLYIEHRSPCFQPAKETCESEKKITISVVTTNANRPIEKQPIVSPPVTPAPQTLVDQLGEQRNEIERLKRDIEQLERDRPIKCNIPTKPLRDGRPSPEKREPQRVQAPRSEVSLFPPNLEQKLPSHVATTPPPKPTPVHLFFRVGSQRVKQVEDNDIEEVIRLLRSLKLSYARGPSYKDRPLGPRYVPIAIHKTPSWRTYEAKNVIHRDKLMK